MCFFVFFFVGVVLVVVIECQILIIFQVFDVSDIKIFGVIVIGIGCFVGYVFVNVDVIGIIFDVVFDRYIVFVGFGISFVIDSCKNCCISINLQFFLGYQ